MEPAYLMAIVADYNNVRTLMVTLTKLVLNLRQIQNVPQMEPNV